MADIQYVLYQGLIIIFCQSFAMTSFLRIGNTQKGKLDKKNSTLQKIQELTCGLFWFNSNLIHFKGARYN